MTLLITLGDILLSDGYGYKFAENEESYREEMKKIGKRVIGFQQNPGYISFDPAYMCALIAQWTEEDTVSASCLERELRRYCGGDNQQTPKWYIEGGYCHVHLRSLVEQMVEPEVDEFAQIQEYIKCFERSFS